MIYAFILVLAFFVFLGWLAVVSHEAETADNARGVRLAEQAQAEAEAAEARAQAESRALEAEARRRGVRIGEVLDGREVA